MGPRANIAAGMTAVNPLGSAAAVPAEPLEAAPEIEFRTVSWHLPAPVAGGPAGKPAEEGGEAPASPPLDRISASIPAGGVTALIGESGAGKSTFCDLAVGLLAPTTGEVRLSRIVHQGT